LRRGSHGAVRCRRMTRGGGERVSYRFTLAARDGFGTPVPKLH
jgi:hypothetical protein